MSLIIKLQPSVLIGKKQSVKCELPEHRSEGVTDHSSASQFEEKWPFLSSEPEGTGFPLMQNRTNAESDAGSVSHSSGIELQMPSVSPIRTCPRDIICLCYTSKSHDYSSLLKQWLQEENLII